MAKKTAKKTATKKTAADRVETQGRGPDNPGTYYEVVVTRTVVQEMRIGVTADSAVEARNMVAAMPRITGENGWHNREPGKAKIESATSKGPIVYRKINHRGRVAVRSTGRPAQV